MNMKNPAVTVIAVLRIILTIFILPFSCSTPKNISPAPAGGHFQVSRTDEYPVFPPLYERNPADPGAARNVPEILYK